MCASGVPYYIVVLVSVPDSNDIMVFLIVAVFATTYANIVQTSETISSDLNKLLKLQQLMQNGIGQSSLVEKMLRRKRQIDDIDDSRIGLRTEQMMNHKTYFCRRLQQAYNPPPPPPSPWT